VNGDVMVNAARQLCGLGRLRPWLVSVVCLAMTLLPPSHAALAQEASDATQQAAAVDPGALVDHVETLANQKLRVLTQELLARRVHPTQFYLEITSQSDPEKLSSLLRSWGQDNLMLLKEELRRSDYFQLRELLSSATVSVRYSNKMSSDEWDIVETELRSYFAKREGNAVEQFDAEPSRLAPDMSEALVEQRARLEREKMEQEYKLKNSLEESKSQLRQREIQREADLKKELTEFEKSALSDELTNERKRRFEMADVFDKDFNPKEYILRHVPLLSRIAALGSGLGLFFVVALAVLGMLLIIASSNLGRHLSRGAFELAIALKGESKGESDRAKELAKDQAGQGDELNKDSGVEFDYKPQFKEAAEKLRSQVERDIDTTAVVLSKVIEEEKYGEVIAIFDILGPDLARTVFSKMTSSSKRSLQRAFYTGQIKRPSLASLFNRVNELRAMLASTDVMMSDASDKGFAQIILAYPDVEIASALANVSVDESVSLLSRLPPERMLAIIRNLPSSLAEQARQRLGRVVRRGIEASMDTVRVFTGAIMDEARLRFEENKRFLQGVIQVSNEQEAEHIIAGLSFDPKLLLEVIGIRATLDDMWAQPVDVIETLMLGLELESIVALIHSAPESVFGSIVSTFTPRKQALASDILDNMKADARYAAELSESVQPVRKNLLAKLSTMAKDGAVTLPSYERLKAEVAKQTELEQRGESYEDHLVAQMADVSAADIAQGVAS
jgi:hypothetical protein